MVSHSRLGKRQIFLNTPLPSRKMPDGDRVVALQRLERLENDHPVIEMIRTGEGVLVRRKHQIERHQHFLLGQQSGELQIRFGVDEPLEVIGDAVNSLQTFGVCGVASRFGSARNGWSSGKGSWSKTSMAAPAIVLSLSAATQRTDVPL